MLKCRGDVLMVGPRGTVRDGDHSVVNVAFDRFVALRGDRFNVAEGERLNPPTGEFADDIILLPYRLSLIDGSGSFWTGEFDCRSS